MGLDSPGTLRITSWPPTSIKPPVCLLPKAVHKDTDDPRTTDDQRRDTGTRHTYEDLPNETGREWDLIDRPRTRDLPVLRCGYIPDPLHFSGHTCTLNSGPPSGEGLGRTSS